MEDLGANGAFGPTNRESDLRQCCRFCAAGPTFLGAERTLLEGWLGGWLEAWLGAGCPPVGLGSRGPGAPTGAGWRSSVGAAAMLPPIRRRADAGGYSGLVWRLLVRPVATGRDYVPQANGGTMKLART